MSIVGLTVMKQQDIIEQRFHTDAVSQDADPRTIHHARQHLYGSVAR